jgi:hypothetical protein
MTRLSGNTHQLVNAKINGANGLPDCKDKLTRWNCIYKRNKQVPATKLTATFSNKENIW